jgi:PAS domain S-box-containing protein
VSGLPAPLERERGTVQGADGAQLLFDEDGCVLAASESCAVVFERDVAELVDRPLDDLVSSGLFDGDLRAQFQTVVADLAAGDGGERTVTGHVRPGGTADRLPYHVTVTPVRVDDRLVGTRWTLSPVGTSERYEETLESLHRATRDLMGAESELAVYDRIGRAANDILGFPGTGVRTYDPDEAVLRHVAFGNVDPLIDSRPPYDVKDSPHGDAFLEGSTRIEEITDDDPYDREVFTHAMYVPIGEYGVLSFGTVGDEFADTDVRFAEILAENAMVAIREVRRREQLDAQRRELQRYETILETVPDPVYAMDADGRITFANGAFADFFGYRPDDDPVALTAVVGENDVARVFDRLDRLVDGDAEDPEPVEIEGVARDGRCRQLDVSLALLPASDQATAAGVLRDVTARKRREEVLTVMNRALRHNLRTNANTIFAYTTAIEEQLPAEHAEYATRIEDAADWLVKLGETLRTLQRTIIESTAEDIEIERLVETVADRYRETHPDATIAVDCRAEGLLAGGHSLKFALDNVVENALVHNDAAAPRVVVATELAGDGWVDITVTDDGPGIPAEEQSVVLGDAEISQLKHGSGLGLWVTRWVVQAFDGEVIITDADPCGTAVTLRLRRISRE